MTDSERPEAVLLFRAKILFIVATALGCNGIDPSSDRFAGLDMANREMAGASTAGAGNQQRMADCAQGNAMQNEAINASPA